MAAPDKKPDEIDEKTIPFARVFKEELDCVSNRIVTSGGEDSHRGPRGFGLPDFSKHSGDKGRSEVFESIETELRDNQQAWDAWIEGKDGGEKPHAGAGALTRSEREQASGLTGLALSGGGIRSATFNLGVVQFLQRSGLFGCLDYMSTVSGGGYLGACVSSSLAAGNKRLFQHQRGVPEPPVFRHLRNNSKYLAPDGFFDYLRVPAVLLRGILVNLVAFASVVTVLAIAYGHILKGLGYTTENMARASLWLWPVGVFGALFVVVSLLYAVAADRFANDAAAAGRGFNARNTSEKALTWIIFLFLLSCVLWAQPFVLDFVGRLRDEQQFQIWLSSAGAAFATISAFADKVGLSMHSIFKKAAMTCGLFLGVLLLYAGFVCMTLLTIENDWAWSGIAFAIAAAVVVLFLFCWNINLTGMHNFYRDRLSRAFVVAEKGTRTDLAENAKHVDPSTLFSGVEVAHNDDLKLSKLDLTIAPYHIINTAINLRHPGEAFQKGRRADNFTFTPKYCGCPLVGYCGTDALERQNPHINLATAMAVSGAAASPNMGRSTNRFIAILLTMFNIRLNYWMRSPLTVCKGGSTGIKRCTDRGLIQFLWEVLGRSKRTDRLVNLSDGGHFDNSGVYELLRRECRFIILGDGECDPSFRFEALSELTRMALVDFGIKVTFDGLDEIREGKRSFAVGTVQYTAERIGKILYLKSNLSGDYNLEATLDRSAYESSPLRDDNRLYNRYTYIAHYKAKHPEFPHESTSDQFFDEAQFECYRALGYEVASRALAGGPAPAEPIS